MATFLMPSPDQRFKTPNIKLDLYTVENPPLWGRTASGDPIYAGGFSGLVYLGETEDGGHQFMTHTDRGPNAEPIKIPGTDQEVRPFLLPDFQPRLVKIQTTFKTKTFRIIEEILLTDFKGEPLSGRPAWFDKTVERSDEHPVDLDGNPLEADVMGMDAEGLAIDSDGNYWMSEEYRPSLMKFDSNGRMLKKFIPQNSLPQKELQELVAKYGEQMVVEALPETYKHRKSNRGLEGLTYSNGKLYAILQSPLKTPDATHKKVIRLLEFDVKTETVTGQYLYPLHHEGVDKIGDLSTWPGHSEILTIEQNSEVGSEGRHFVTSFKLEPKITDIDPEKTPWEDLKSQSLAPSIILSLPEIGYDFAEKVEGIAAMSADRIAVINDNDFGVGGDLDFKTKRVPLRPDKKSVLAILQLPKSAR